MHVLKLDYDKFITFDLSNSCMLNLGLYFQDKYQQVDLYAFMVNYESDVSEFNKRSDYKVVVERVENEGIENIVLKELTKEN